MSTFSKVINAVSFKYKGAEMREAIAPMETRNTLVENNFLLQIHRGDYWMGEKSEPMEKGSFYFVPKGHRMFFRMCKADRYDIFGEEGYGSDSVREKYSVRINPFGDQSDKKQIHSIVSFDALLYDTIPFFSILDLPAITIPNEEELSFLMRELVLEEAQEKIGKEALLQSMTQEIVIRICRYVDSQKQFTANIEKINYLTDKRLADMVKYIKQNLDKDLTNKNLAAISFLSEDYVGQYFKNLTNQNLQDFVEKQRLEKALQLINSTSDNIQEIAFKVGFRDPAYFSRRFKLLYNKNANEIRKS